MKRSTKTLLVTLGVATAAGIGIAVATRKRAATGPAATTDVPDWMLGYAVADGYTTYGWYTYKGSAPATMWIRIDRGPEEGGVLVDVPWQWTIFLDRSDAAGKVPIATGEKSWTDLYPLYASDTLREYADDEMANMTVRAAADQIDAMYSEEAV